MHDLVGAEFLAGIPGTVGGALAMNAGCYGGETGTSCASVTTVDRTGALHERTPRATIAIGYRTSSLRARRGVRGRRMVRRARVFALRARRRRRASREQIKELLAQRIASQPLGEPNAGSVFRNPPGDYAARLIEDCGLKGHAIGGARDLAQARELHRQHRATRARPTSRR